MSLKNYYFLNSVSSPQYNYLGPSPRSARREIWHTYPEERGSDEKL